MPFIIIGGYRVGFYSNERNEPPHVHVIRNENEAKYWLNPVALAHNFGFNAREIGRVEVLIIENAARLLEMWHDHLG